MLVELTADNAFVARRQVVDTMIRFSYVTVGATLLGLLLSVAITLVLAIIVDVDRPREGLIRVSQQPLLDLQKQLRPR